MGRTATIFMNGRSQAVRIPEEFAFKGVTKVTIRRDGKRLMGRSGKAGSPSMMTPNRRGMIFYRSGPICSRSAPIESNSKSPAEILSQPKRFLPKICSKPN